VKEHVFDGLFADYSNIATEYGKNNEGSKDK